MTDLLYWTRGSKQSNNKSKQSFTSRYKWLQVGFCKHYYRKKITKTIKPNFLRSKWPSECGIIWSSIWHSSTLHTCFFALEDKICFLENHRFKIPAMNFTRKIINFPFKIILVLWGWDQYFLKWLHSRVKKVGKTVITKI